ncbi:hypothetical protein [Streptomyces sp. S186]|uniref:hypothetical protein n=1 Tax=Streptomyces sp. S186 TaxID=3434395 RepID=UPI003F67DC1B
MTLAAAAVTPIPAVVVIALIATAVSLELRAREKRHDDLDIKPLPSGSRERSTRDWTGVQQEFADRPTSDLGGPAPSPAEGPPEQHTGSPGGIPTRIDLRHYSAFFNRLPAG